MSPSGDAKLRLVEGSGEFTLLRKEGGDWKESVRGKLRPQRGCFHYTVHVADGGAYFAVWKTPFNSHEETNTPLGVYLGDGTAVRVYGLFEIFDRETLAEDIRFAKRLA